MAPRAGQLALPALACGLLFMLCSTAHAAFCTPTSGTCWPDKAALNAWISTLSGATAVVLWDKTPDKFISASATMNPLKSNFPGLIVSPVSERDLRSAVQFAQTWKLRVVTRCSGQDYNGRSNGRGVMLIRTDKLNHVEMDPETGVVTFGAGATHEDVYAAVANFGRVFVGGQSRTVCPAGCLAGGCHGLLSRQYGLGIDSVLSIQLMLFNGTLLTAARDCYADLFHAYLGAGANSFAVALSFSARTYPAPAQILKLEVSLATLNQNLRGATFPNLFSEYILNLRWFNSLPLELAANIVADGAGGVYIRFYYTGGDYVGAFNALQPMLNSPYVRGVTPITNYSSMLEVVRDNEPAASELWSRTFLGNAFLPPRQDVLSNVSRILGATTPPMVLWLVFGGAVRIGNAGSVPGGMRAAMYEAVFGDKWFDPAEDEARMEVVSSAYLPVLYSFGAHSYSNEYTTWGNRFNILADWKSRFFADYAGLMRVKQKYDPCNVFTVRFGVGSDQPTGTCFDD